MTGKPTSWGVTQRHNLRCTTWGVVRHMPPHRHHHRCISHSNKYLSHTTSQQYPQPPAVTTNDLLVYVHVSTPPSVAQGIPSSASSLLLAFPDEGSIVSMLDIRYPLSDVNCVVLTMTALSATPALGPAQLAPTKMLPPLTDTQGSNKCFIKVCVILHAKRWNGITTQHTEPIF
jgi:hypothetical protein